MPVLLSATLTDQLNDIDQQIAGLWAQHRAYITGQAHDVNALRNLPLIDQLLDRRHALQTTRLGPCNTRA